MNIIISKKNLEALIKTLDYSDTGLPEFALKQQAKDILEWLNSLNTTVSFILEEDE